MTDAAFSNRTSVDADEAILADLDHLRDDLVQLANEMARATTTRDALTGVAIPQAAFPRTDHVTNPANTTDFGLAAGLATPHSAEAEAYLHQMFSLMAALAMGLRASRTRTGPRADLTVQGKL